MEETPDEVTVTYTYSAAEEQKALMSDPMRRRMMSLIWGMYPAVYVFHFAQRALRDEPFDVTLALWTLIPGLLFVPIPYFVNRLLVAGRRRHTADGTKVARRFSPQGFAISADSSLIPWGMITQVIETRIAFLVTDASSTGQVVVPKRVLSPEQLTQLRLILAREFQSRPKELKLLPVR